MNVIDTARIEVRNLRLIEAKRKLRECLDDMSYLILATPSSERRNDLTDANLLIMQGGAALHEIKTEPL